MGQIDGTSWRVAEVPLLFDKYFKAKPAYYSVADIPQPQVPARISYYTDSGTPNTIPDVIINNLATPITLQAAPTKSGSTFKGWYNGSKLCAAGSSYTATGDTIFVAVWQQLSSAKSYIAVDNTWVESGKTTVMSSISSLLIKNSTTTPTFRKAFIKFDLSAYTGAPITTAKLKIQVCSVESGSVSKPASVFDVPDSSWSSSTMLWSNVPAYLSSTPLATTTITGNAAYEFDVSQYVASEYEKGNKTISLAIDYSNFSGSTSGFKICSNTGAVTNILAPTLLVDSNLAPNILLMNINQCTYVASNSSITVAAKITNTKSTDINANYTFGLYQKTSNGNYKLVSTHIDNATLIKNSYTNINYDFTNASGLVLSDLIVRGFLWNNMNPLTPSSQSTVQ